ncbi:hypothetical protein BDV59DRAFT_121090 [Aspergillus ambiguus]|uniref:uncharacterized protein n=1 Tax=Aspergillus ambiguus TaxID=176160 RepID=UPI003CCE0BE5
MASASLCHSDLLPLEQPDLTPPFTIGHEGAGYVVEVGSAVPDRGFKAGALVGFLYINDCCFECEGCQVHNMNCTKGHRLLRGLASSDSLRNMQPSTGRMSLPFLRCVRQRRAQQSFVPELPLLTAWIPAS